MKTKISFAVVSLCASITFGGCMSMPVTPVEIVVDNKTGQAIMEIYCSPAFSNFSGIELLTGNRLEKGQSRNLWFDPDISAAYWDILAVDVHGNEYTVTGIPIAKTPIITLSVNNNDDSETLDFDDFDDFDNFDDFSAVTDFSLDTL